MITREEKIKALDSFCDNYLVCEKCPIYGLKLCHTGFSDMSDEELDTAINGIDPAILHELIRKLEQKLYDACGTSPHILDSGNRREFETGAVRDIQEGKGRCDLMPLDVVALVNGCGEDSHIIRCLYDFQNNGMTIHLFGAIEIFTELYFNNSIPTMLLEVAKHFEEGAKKYGESNWQKGIPTHCYIDSAVRHYLKYLRGDKDEPHDRAFCWNIMCCIWTCVHKPELNDYAKKEENT